MVVRGTVATWLGGAGVAGVFLADALRSVRQLSTACEPLKATYPDAGIAIGIADWSASPLTGHTQNRSLAGRLQVARRRVVPLTTGNLPPTRQIDAVRQ